MKQYTVFLCFILILLLGSGNGNVLPEEDEGEGEVIQEYDSSDDYKTEEDEMLDHGEDDSFGESGSGGYEVVDEDHDDAAIPEVNLTNSDDNSDIDQHSTTTPTMLPAEVFVDEDTAEVDDSDSEDEAQIGSGHGSDEETSYRPATGSHDHHHHYGHHHHGHHHHHHFVDDVEDTTQIPNSITTEPLILSEDSDDDPEEHIEHNTVIISSTTEPPVTEDLVETEANITNDSNDLEHSSHSMLHMHHHNDDDSTTTTTKSTGNEAWSSSMEVHRDSDDDYTGWESSSEELFIILHNPPVTAIPETNDTIVSSISADTEESTSESGEIINIIQEHSITEVPIDDPSSPEDYTLSSSSIRDNANERVFNFDDDTPPPRKNDPNNYITYTDRNEKGVAGSSGVLRTPSNFCLFVILTTGIVLRI